MEEIFLSKSLPQIKGHKNHVSGALKQPSKWLYLNCRLLNYIEMKEVFHI